MAKDEKKVLSSMDMMKQAKAEREIALAGTKQIQMSDWVPVNELTWMEQQKQNIENLYSEKGYDSDPYIKTLFEYEKYNRHSSNPLDPFDVPLRRKQGILSQQSYRLYPMMFMTHPEATKSNYCVVNIMEYTDDIFNEKKIIFLDPGIFELTKADEYPEVELLHRIANSQMPSNLWMSIDYPVDMNLSKADLFLKKSIQNNFRYADNEQYICCIQIEKQDDFDTFKYRFDELSEIFLNKRKIVGLGCFHSLQPNPMQDKMIQYMCSKGNSLYWIHFYGIGLALIRKYLPKLQAKGIRVSFDSTKYKFAANEKIRKGYGFTVGRRKTNPIFYYGYIEKLIEAQLDVIW